jgi:hypothetical protein
LGGGCLKWVIWNAGLAHIRFNFEKVANIVKKVVRILYGRNGHPTLIARKGEEHVQKRIKIEEAVRRVLLESCRMENKIQPG